jgi:hypothetical protein
MDGYFKYGSIMIDLLCVTILSEYVLKPIIVNGVLIYYESKLTASINNIFKQYKITRTIEEFNNSKQFINDNVLERKDKKHNREMLMKSIEYFLFFKQE